MAFWYYIVYSNAFCEFSVYFKGVLGILSARAALDLESNIVVGNEPRHPSVDGVRVRPRSRRARGRLQLLLELAGTENMSLLAANVLAVKFWLLTGPSLLYIVSKSVLYTLYSGTYVLSQLYLSVIAEQQGSFGTSPRTKD